MCAAVVPLNQEVIDLYLQIDINNSLRRMVSEFENELNAAYRAAFPNPNPVRKAIFLVISLIVWSVMDVYLLYLIMS